MAHEPGNLPPPAAKPAGVRELTLRAVIIGMLVAAIMGSAYPYVVLKLGFGPNVSVVAAFFGFIFLGLFSRTYNRWENNLVQTAGTAAAQTAFMCVLLAVPMRRHFVVDEKLAYPDGIAAAATLMVLDGRGREAGRATRVLLVGATLSVMVAAMTEDFHLVSGFSSILPLGPPLIQDMGVGLNWSLLSVGSGMLVGLRINVSMLLGTILSWVVAPYVLTHEGWISEGKRTAVLFWVMWPARACSSAEA